MNPAARTFFLLFAILCVAPVYAASLNGTKHDLSASVTQRGDQGLCRFCHSVHSGDGQAALWGAEDFTVNQSETMGGTMLQTAEGSMGCLSCHDGVIAFGALLASTGTDAGNNMITDFPGSLAILGANLDLNHPVGVDITADTNGIAGKSTIIKAGLKIYGGKVECGSCHDAHGTDGYPYFLRLDPSAGTLCTACHTK